MRSGCVGYFRRISLGSSYGWEARCCTCISPGKGNIAPSLCRTIHSPARGRHNSVRIQRWNNRVWYPSSISPMHGADQKRRNELKNLTSLFRTLVAVSALAFVSMAAHAATIHLKADLKASAEVPPKDSAGTGTLTATLDTETNEFKYHVEFSGLTGAVVAAHFHGRADEGANGNRQADARVSEAAWRSLWILP